MAVKRFNGTSWVTVADNTIPQNPSVAQTTEPAIRTDGLIWVETDASTPTVAVTRWVKQPANGTTVLTGNDDYGVNLAFTAGYEMVHVNGVLLSRTLDYTTSTNSITLLNATVTGDIVEIVCPLNIQYTDAIPKSTAIAKGDLLAASAYNTVTNLPVGANDQVLVADSTQASGMAWKSNAKQSVNAVINGGMDIWQRGTSGTVTSGISYPSADRWNAWTLSAGGSVTLSRQTTGDTTNLPNIQYCGRFQRVAGNTNTSILILGQAFETVNSIPFAGKTITLSFYARKGADFSASGNALTVELWQTATTDASLNTMLSTKTNIAASTPTLTSTWQRFTLTGTVLNTTTQIAPAFFYSGSGTAGTNDYFEITGVQLELGSTATPFSRAGGTIQGELAACQRYYWRGTANATYTYFAPTGMAFNTGGTRNPVPLPVPMRIYPTAFDYSGIAASDTVTLYSGGSWGLVPDGTVQEPVVGYNHTSGALTQYRPYFIQANNNASAYIAFNAEL